MRDKAGHRVVLGTFLVHSRSDGLMIETDSANIADPRVKEREDFYDGNDAAFS